MTACLIHIFKSSSHMKFPLAYVKCCNTRLINNLTGEGSHRHLSTSVRFDINQQSISDLPDHYCEAIIIEKMPSGVYAVPFEGTRSSAPQGDTNLESPSIQSNRSLVEIHMDVGSNALSGN